MHLRAADPEIPPQLHDRASDNWRPLLAIADAVGEPWPARARHAAVQLSGNKRNAETPAAALLADIRDVFTEAGADRMESRLLAIALASKDEGPWAEWRNGKPITVNQIAAILGHSAFIRKPSGSETRRRRAICSPISRTHSRVTFRASGNRVCQGRTVTFVR